MGLPVLLSTLILIHLGFHVSQIMQLSSARPDGLFKMPCYGYFSLDHKECMSSDTA